MGESALLFTPLHVLLIQLVCLSTNSNALMAALSGPYRYERGTFSPTVAMLLDAGASANSPPSELYTSPLQAAISNRQFAVAHRLLDDGADVNAHDSRFGTALTAASCHGELEMMKRLVEMGANPSLAGRKYGLVVRILNLSAPPFLSLSVSLSLSLSLSLGRSLSSLFSLCMSLANKGEAPPSKRLPEGGVSLLSHTSSLCPSST